MSIPQFRNVPFDGLSPGAGAGAVHAITSDALKADMVWREQHTVTKALFILEPTDTAVWTCNGFVPVLYLIKPLWLRTRAV